MTQTPISDERGEPEEAGREVARGRRASTPFVALGGVAAVVGLAAGLLIAVVLLIWFLL
jgi:hypothetical protein